MSQSEKFCPYVGLKPFNKEEANYFKGRKADIEVICSNIFASRLTILYGASGVGKSSLLMAGVIPELERHKRIVIVLYRDWQGDDFLSALKNECVKAVTEKLTGLARPISAPKLDSNLPLDELILQCNKELGGTIVFLLDQFEEYFLYRQNLGTHRLFASELARAINKSEIDASFLIGMREDSIAKLDKFQARIPNLLENTLRVRHLNEESAKKAIIEPLEVYNESYGLADPVQIEPELVSEIIRTARSKPGLLGESVGMGDATQNDEERPIEAAFLQLVLTKLWEEELPDSRWLRLNTLNEKLGGVHKIVREYFDDVMERLAEGNKAYRAACVKMFKFLVTPTGTKIAYPFEALLAVAEISPSEVKELLVRLQKARVLRKIDHPESYEIFHDKLASAILDWRLREERTSALEASQAKAEEATRVAYKFRAYALLLGIVLLALAVAAIVAFKETRAAEKSAQDATQHANSAQKARSAEADARTKAEESAKLADQKANEAERAKVAEADARTKAEESAKLADQKANEAERAKVAEADARAKAEESAKREKEQADKASAVASNLLSLQERYENLQYDFEKALVANRKEQEKLLQGYNTKIKEVHSDGEKIGRDWKNAVPSGAPPNN